MKLIKFWTLCLKRLNSKKKKRNLRKILKFLNFLLDDDLRFTSMRPGVTITTSGSAELNSTTMKATRSKFRKLKQTLQISTSYLATEMIREQLISWLMEHILLRTICTSGSLHSQKDKNTSLISTWVNH